MEIYLLLVIILSGDPMPGHPEPNIIVHKEWVSASKRQVCEDIAELRKSDIRPRLNPMGQALLRHSCELQPRKEMT